MNYQLYYQDGYYKIRNNLGQICCAQMGKHVTERKFVGSQQAANFCSAFLVGRSVPFFPTVWVEPLQTPAKPVSTMVSSAYKPAHGGYPDAYGSVSGGTVTGRMKSDVSYSTEQAKRNNDPLVWPYIPGSDPQADDGSNEEATTVPDALVHAIAQRVFIVRIQRALRGY